VVLQRHQQGDGDKGGDDGVIDEATLRAAMLDANVPTLLMVLVQLSGDRRWLEEPYRPSVGRGLSDNDSGGLPDVIQDEIRAAAVATILAWRDGAPIDEVRADRIVDATGAEHEVDVIVVATGFDVLHFLTTYELRGRDGTTLREVWDDDASAYLGLAVPGFPNFFCMYGPNTQPGHGGSLLFVLERQMNYIRDLLLRMWRNDVATVECRRDVHDRYNKGVDRAHEDMVWTHPGMETYYRNTRGRVVVNLPYRNVDLWHMTARADLHDYVVEHTVPVEHAEVRG